MMQSVWSQWAIVAGILIVLEMFLGSFVLLIFGIACLITAMAAYVGMGLSGQLLCFSLIACVGGIWGGRRLRHKWRHDRQYPNGDLDIGQKVEVTAWLADGMARVRYRGADWEARVVSPELAIHDAPFFIVKREDHILWICNDIDVIEKS